MSYGRTIEKHFVGVISQLIEADQNPEKKLYDSLGNGFPKVKGTWKGVAYTGRLKTKMPLQQPRGQHDHFHYEVELDKPVSHPDYGTKHTIGFVRKSGEDNPDTIEHMTEAEQKGSFTETRDHEQHPLHSTAVAAGLKYKQTYQKGSKVSHQYVPDHHWKSGVDLKTETRKGSPPKHSWISPIDWSSSGTDAASLKNHLDKVQSGYDRMVDDHQHNRGQFKNGGR